jgi:hypothetical protein
MTSGAYVHFQEPGGGITREQWEAFCVEHEIVYDPLVAGRNVYLRGGRMGIECAFGSPRRGAEADKAEPPEFAEHVHLSTFWGGPRKRELAALAGAFWVQFGGSMYADEELRKLICEREQVRA